MNISIKTVRDDLPLGARELAEEKLEPLAKLCGADAETATLDCEIEGSLEAVRAGAKYKAIGNLAVGGQVYHAIALGETLEAAVDSVRHELAQELKHARGKRRSLLRRGGERVKDWLRFGS